MLSPVQVIYLSAKKSVLQKGGATSIPVAAWFIGVIKLDLPPTFDVRAVLILAFWPSVNIFLQLLYSMWFSILEWEPHVVSL